MKKFIKYLLFTFCLIFISSFNACEDPAIGDYIERNFVEAFITVGDPIENIVVMKTQPLDKPFVYSEALIRDAKVVISGDGREVELVIDEEGEQGYYYPDKDFRIKAETQYELEITFADGSKVTGKTMTPPQIELRREIPPFYQFPFDSLNAPPTDTVFWNRLPGYDFYIIGIECLDTLEYGKYLDPPTTEMNRRIERGFRGDGFFKDTKSWAFVPNDQSPVVWAIFKWYGLQEFSVAAPDFNMLRWFLQNRISREYNELLNSLEGNGFGVFGSQSIRRDTSVLLKNTP